MLDFPYPEGPFTPVYVVGGSGGSAFGACKWVTNKSALVVKKLEFWYGTDHLHGFRMTYADNSLAEDRGSKTNDNQSITFALGEQVTALTLWGNGVGTRAGRIRIVTDRGQIFDAGKDTKGQTAYEAPTGSGILVGMCGYAGSAIDALGAVFLEGSIDDITIDDVVYNPSLNGKSAGIGQVTFDSVHYKNPPDATKPLEWKFADSVGREVSTTFTQLTSTMYGVNVSITVNASLFGIGGSATTGFTWETTKTQENSNSTSYTKTLSWEASSSLSPGEGVTCSAVSQMGVGSAKYTSRVTIKLTDGTVTSYTESGVFNNIVYTTASVDVAPDKSGKPAKPIEGPRPRA